MNYKVLYRKYRPSIFSEIVGQNNVVNILRKSIIQDKTAHAYIFTGIRGTGKTSMAKIFAKSINCLNPIEGEACCKCESCLSIIDSPDIIEIDAASNNSVDNIRELIENTRLVPSFLKYKVYIIDEVHMLSSGAFNALLKTLEEPANHIKFILATTEVQKVPITILSRCQRFEFSKISEQEITNHLLNICKKEKISITEEAAQEISYLSDGSIRDALSILDQLSTENNEINIKIIEKGFGTLSNKNVKDFIDIINKGSILEIHEKIESFKTDGIDVVILITKMLHIYKENVLYGLESQKLQFKKMKKIIVELSEKLNIIKNSYDSYLIFELIIIDSILSWKDDFKEEPKNNELLKTISKKEELNNNDKKNSQRDYSDLVKKENNDLPNDEIDKIRINNCFSRASKEEKEVNSKLWKNFIKQMQDNNLIIYSFIEGSNVEASSKQILLISTERDNTLLLLKKNREEIEKTFNEINKQNLLLSFITKKNWSNEKKNYIENFKSGKKYEILEEPKINTKKKDVIADQAKEIFGEDSVDLR